MVFPVENEEYRTILMCKFGPVYGTSPMNMCFSMVQSVEVERSLNMNLTAHRTPKPVRC